jgi:hypothetical protein
MSYHDHHHARPVANGQIIVVGEDIIGILQVHRDRSRLRVVDPRFDILDGSTFHSVDQAVAAAEKVVRLIYEERNST